MEVNPLKVLSEILADDHAAAPCATIQVERTPCANMRVPQVCLHRPPPKPIIMGLGNSQDVQLLCKFQHMAVLDPLKIGIDAKKPPGIPRAQADLSPELMLFLA